MIFSLALLVLGCLAIGSQAAPQPEPILGAALSIAGGIVGEAAQVVGDVIDGGIGGGRYRGRDYDRRLDTMSDSLQQIANKPAQQIVIQQSQNADV